MKNTKKAFTLVELIVVITILAVLATVAFISLTGHAQDAKNSKVTADLRTLASALETSMTKGDVGVKTAITGDLNATNSVAGDFGSGTVTINNGTTYGVGYVDFVKLGQNSTDFVDSNDNPYLYAFAASGAIAQYQIAGEITEASGDRTAVVKGNYIEVIAADVDGLISTTSNTDGVTE